MAKAQKQSGADDLLDQMARLADETKATIETLLAANRDVDTEAAEKKRPNTERIEKLDAAFARLTGKPYLKRETEEAKPTSGKRSRRSGQAMEALAGAVYSYMKSKKDGVSGPDIRANVPGLEAQDNVSLLLKKFKHKFSTEGPRKNMLYIAE